LLALTLLACPSEDPEPRRDWTPEAVAPIAFADFCAAAVPAYCRHLERCRPADAAEPYEDCLVHQGAAWCAAFEEADLAEGLTAGRLTWDAAEAGRCVADLAAPACRTEKASRRCTSELFSGAVEPGGACVSRDGVTAGPECRSGVCARSSACAGACAFGTGLGEPCDASYLCGDGRWCRGPSGGACEGTGCTCEARPGEGAACPDPSREDVCARGLVCRAGACARPGGPGTPCASALGCDGDLRCTAGACAARAAAGAPCAFIDDCAAGLTCRADGRCGPFAAEDDPCAHPSDLHGGGDCGLGAHCFGGLCLARERSLLADCLGRNGCFGRDLYCTVVAGLFSVCRGPAGPGQRCYEAPCADPTTHCQGGTCVARGGSGAECFDTEDCLSGICYALACVDACAAP